MRCYTPAVLERSFERATRNIAGLLHAAGVAVTLCACHAGGAARGPIRVAAAASLSSAFEDLGAAYTRKTGQSVSFTFGSSGLLARQILEGAPFDAFAAADRASAQRVGTSVCDPATRHVYARGRLAIWSRASSAGSRARSLQELIDPRFVRIAIANPETAPYGQAAREALKRAGVWDALAPRIVYAENVRQALQLAETGNAEVALIASSLVFDKPGNPGLLIDPAMHAPLEQEIIACRRGSHADAARAFVAFVASSAADAVLARHGLDRPMHAEERSP